MTTQIQWGYLREAYGSIWENITFLWENALLRMGFMIGTFYSYWSTICNTQCLITYRFYSCTSGRHLVLLLICLVENRNWCLLYRFNSRFIIEQKSIVQCLVFPLTSEVWIGGVIIIISMSYDSLWWFTYHYTNWFDLFAYVAQQWKLCSRPWILMFFTNAKIQTQTTKHSLAKSFVS